MRINAQKRTISVKLVYYGPGLGGKTTNLEMLHRQFPEKQRGAMLQLDTETERTLFFDYFPLSLGTLGGYKVKVDFFTVPGQSFYLTTRRIVLQGVDGLVFVADSSPDREEANLLSKDDLIANLETNDKKLADLPHVYQWNKRDIPGALPVKLLQKQLNPEGAPAFPAVALNGEGVWECQSALLQQVFDTLRAQAGGARPASG
ncbi:MAG: gliding-motility protein MglA [Alphaproteobacteria bacterium]|nr:gliding-motility protein MglA [Alphaproteobacteria bacterium]